HTTTAAQPKPISSRFAPVMFAVAYCVYVGSFPACQAKYMSTAYSGSTAISARNASARLCGMSTCATSAAQERRTAAPKMPTPEGGHPARGGPAGGGGGIGRRREGADLPRDPGRPGGGGEWCPRGTRRCNRGTRSAGPGR